MKKSQDLRREIIKHSKQIIELTKELRDLTVIETEDKKEKNKVQKPKKPRRNSTINKTGPLFSEGYRVVITNNYKGKKGTTSKVTKNIGDFTFLEDRYGEFHQRAHHNLRLLTQKVKPNK